MAALIKAILVLRNGVIPPLANFSTPNPALDLDASPFYLPTEAVAWPRGDQPRRAGVTALGVGGTNVHMIVEEPPPARPGRRTSPPALVPLPLSARTGTALATAVRGHADHLSGRQDLDPADIAFTAGAGRRHFRHRAVVLGADTAALAGALRRPARFTGVVPEQRTPTAFVFSGQGGTYGGMARAHYDRYPVFRAVIDECDAVHREETGRSLLPELTGPATDRDWETEVAQPALFAHQSALVRLWRELGVAPDVVAGHSIGEIAALCAAGAFTVADGMRLSAVRGGLMRRLSPVGGMLAVAASREETDAILAGVPGLDLAVINGTGEYVLSGEPEPVARAAALCEERALRRHVLPVNRAFHSRLLASALDEWAGQVAMVSMAPLTTAFVSGLDGVTREAGWRPDAGYLVRQAAEPVRYDLVLDRLRETGCGAVLEVGPTATLTGIAGRTAPGTPAVATQRRGREAAALVEAASRLYCGGAEIVWSALLAGSGGGRIPLPGYPYERRTYWTGPMPLPEFTEPRQEPQQRPTEGTQAMSQDSRTAERVARAVTEMTVRHIGCEAADVTPQVAFVDLGADSLQMINMVREVEKEFDVKVSMRELFEEAGTPGLLSELVARRMGTAPTAAPAAPAPVPVARVTSEPVNAPVVAAPAALVPALAAAPVAPGPELTLESLAQQIQVLAQVQTQMMTQLSQLLDTFSASGR